MNKVILMGRLTRDPEVRNQSGDPQKMMARYTLAVDRRFRRDGESTADFLNCVVFGRGAEFAEKYLHKGTKILAVGRLQTGSYTNRDGQKVNTVDIIVEEQEFAESKNSSASGSEGNAAGGFSGSRGTGFGGSSRSGGNSGSESSGGEGFMEIPEGMVDDLPFN